MKPWAGRAAQDVVAWCKANLGYRCWLCGRQIAEDDYSVDHVLDRKHYPHLTWVKSNWQPAHGRKHPEWGCPGNYGRSGRKRPIVRTWTAPGW